MRAVRRLERRFNDALANLEQKYDNSETDAKLSKLSNEIEELNTESSKKDQKIDELTKELTAAKEASDDTAAKQADLNIQNEAKQKEIDDLKEQLGKVVDSEAAARSKITEMQQQLDEVKNLKKDASELADVKILLVEAQSKSEGNEKQIEELTASLQQMRLDQENNVVNAGDLNVAMKAELDALNRQRANDVNEVNMIIEKLTPLVGAK